MTEGGAQREREREEREKKKKERVVQVLQLVRLLPPSLLCAVPLIARNVFNPPSFSRRKGGRGEKEKITRAIMSKLVGRGKKEGTELLCAPMPREITRTTSNREKKRKRNYDEISARSPFSFPRPPETPLSLAVYCVPFPPIFFDLPRGNK